MMSSPLIEIPVLALAVGAACAPAPTSVEVESGTTSGTTGPGSQTTSGGDEVETGTGTESSSDGSTASAADGTTSSSDSTGSSGPDDPSTTGEPRDPLRPPEQCPEPPDELVHWIVGDPADADVDPSGPGLILMGGGPDVDEAFVWWGDFLAGGDVVVLRASGADGYNDYLYSEFAAVDSVETLLVDSVALGDDPYVGCRIRQAEGVFMAGGDQAQYMASWSGQEVADALAFAHARGAVIGGTSAGMAVLGEHVFAAYNGTVYPEEMLEDPYNEYATLDTGLLALPWMEGVITDTHFYERDRMGRLIGFVARLVQDGWDDPAVGIGVDEATALVVDPDGHGTVLGSGRVYVLHSGGTPAVCAPGQPLTYEGLELYRLDPGDTLALPGATTDDAVPIALGASAGVLEPSDPY